MPRELERAVVSLVCKVLGADLDRIPTWLVRPGRAECAGCWPLVQSLYAQLSEGLQLPEVMRTVERRHVDAVLRRPGAPLQILEVDETQHFNLYRAHLLQVYAAQVELAFPAQLWIDHSLRKTRLEGGGFAAPRPPLFPGQGGRHRQRAFRDALADILPPEHGCLPTLRIAHFEVEDWVFESEADQKMAELLEARLGVGS